MSQKTHEDAYVAAQVRESEQQARDAKQALVGKLAEDAGLLAYDLATLADAFVRLARTLKERHDGHDHD